MTVTEKLERLREWMEGAGVEAFIVPSNDPHFSEYVSPHWGCRAWLSGFDGSAATVVVTRAGKAALWTDSRYFLQAETQLKDTGIELQKQGLPDTPTIVEWLQANLQLQDKIGLDGKLISHTGYETLWKELGAVQLESITTGDPFEEIWPDRPALPQAKAFALDESYTGETVAGKLDRIRDQTEGIRLVAVLDEIAWTLNIRGADIQYNPLVVSYLAIEPERAILFVDQLKFETTDQQKLTREGVEFQPYESLDEYLTTLQEKVVTINPGSLNEYHHQLLLTSGAEIRPEVTPYGSLITRFKSIKNQTEIEGFRKAMEWDGVALVRFQIWLENQLTTGGNLTELEVGRKLCEFREANRKNGFRGESFGTITGYGEHGAIVHYSVTDQTDIPIGTDSLLLIDSGGQYLFGTTDITRTYHFGIPTEEQINHYTAVLRGMIDLSAARFPRGTRGAQLDVLARKYLWQNQLNYLHGTGHGIGHYLCVHEGPQSIRMNENPVVLQPGMIQSCEPGVYLAGQYGIRIENALLAKDGPKDFMEFETLTLCPISLLGRPSYFAEMLDKDQKAWLNQYHEQVYNRLKPYLEAEEAEWLTGKCKPI